MEVLPCLVPEQTLAPLLLRKPVLGLVCGLMALSFPLSMAYRATGDLLLALGRLPLVLGETYPVAIPLVLAAWFLFRRFHPPVRKGTRLFRRQIQVERARFEVIRSRGQRMGVVLLSLRATGLAENRLEVVVRFRGPDGFYLASPLQSYRGDRGEVRLQILTRLLEGPVSEFDPLCLALPLRALGLPDGSTGVSLVAEILLGIEGEVFAEHDLPIEFEPVPEDFSRLLTATKEALDGELVALKSDDGEDPPERPAGIDPSRHCGLCGEDLELDVLLSCSACQTRHHRECWDFRDGCSVKGCDGLPEPK
jgi:hypothetical protein